MNARIDPNGTGLMIEEDVKRLLVVEDNPEARLLMQHMLRGPYEARIVAGAGEALDAVKQATYDGFLIDIHLGTGQDGVQLLASLRACDGAANVPALAVTAYGLPDHDSKFRSFGFDGYLSKPFSRTALLAAVEKLMREKG